MNDVLAKAIYYC